MSDVIIKAENLGKKYTIGHQAQNSRYMALRDVLVYNAKNIWHKTKDLVSSKPIIQGDTKEEVWALKDVSFEIRHGEVVGIIGRNGAGKSTLLKALSRITEPTTGRVTIRGRVASLLEVGTGFHPELTGRENIYLNGTILGMTRNEIRRKFDEIVNFAEIEKYLDTPVKRYSSGMYVRLAFAVAAHLEPEILVVDEVLAVGDAEFQKKCLGKMQDVSTNEGRTVLFVSHNMGSIAQLCNKAFLLQKGLISDIGEASTIIKKYLQTDKANNNVIIADISQFPRTEGLGEIVKFTKCSIKNSNDEFTNKLFYGEPFSIVFEIESKVLNREYNVVIGICSATGEYIAAGVSNEDNLKYVTNNYKIYGKVEINKFVLHPGQYTIRLGVRALDAVQEAFKLEVLDSSYGNYPEYQGVWGHINLSGKWSCINEDIFSER
jgi:lipopolysaccharide transport system ATP-binding protein